MNIEKLKACIVYACSKAVGKLDPVKLNKVLWYSDTAAYMAGGESITGGRYIRKPKGPVMAYMASVLQELESDGMLKSGKRHDVDRGEWVIEYLPVNDSLRDKLSAKERGILDHSIQRACYEHTTHQISERTHGEIWEVASNGEEIPLFTMFAERLAPITQRDFDAALAA